ncbi:hypothetical protein BDQ12DRAFT_681890 [Crucibulum laeve]|uniref:Uncharacterized protein n=1 Tax=Crucibulum laeve TaxID=68775 RepID=A0A5C3M6K9_9AGAR|nr:hypothetical protein BDQ12DRAFT_681890 [Crucibulum laeve]
MLSRYRRGPKLRHFSSSKRCHSNNPSNNLSRSSSSSRPNSNRLNNNSRYPSNSSHSNLSPNKPNRSNRKCYSSRWPKCNSSSRRRVHHGRNPSRLSSHNAHNLSNNSTLSVRLLNRGIFLHLNNHSNRKCPNNPSNPPLARTFHNLRNPPRSNPPPLLPNQIPHQYLLDFTLPFLTPISSKPRLLVAVLQRLSISALLV